MPAPDGEIDPRAVAGGHHSRRQTPGAVAATQGLAALPPSLIGEPDLHMGERRVEEMRRWLIGLVLGTFLGWMAPGQVQGAQQPEQLPLKETPIAAARGSTLTIPPVYGRLVNVAVSSGVHHLYFQDAQGIIRIVLVGPQGAVQRAKHGLQLLSRKVYTIEREGIVPRGDGE